MAPLPRLEWTIDPLLLPIGRHCQGQSWTNPEYFPGSDNAAAISLPKGNLVKKGIIKVLITNKYYLPMCHFFLGRGNRFL
jgi:hypothetical protein